MPFTCSICEEESTRICVACTKDSCDNHLCEKCSRCSDCCGCEVKLDEGHGAESHHPGASTSSSPPVAGEELLLASEPLSEQIGALPEHAAEE